MKIIGDVELEAQQVRVNGIHLTVLTAGNENAKPLLCLHGFPDTPDTFIHQYQVFIDAGYKIVAPYLRGYPPSETGKHVDYLPLRLGEDVVALIDEFCGGSAYMISHDWGAVAAYFANQIAPEKIKAMVASAVPPFKVFETSVGDIKQAWRSRYAIFFQLGCVANWWTRRNNLQGLDWLWGYWSPTWQYTLENIQPLKDCLGQAGAMEAATQYYRSMTWGAMTHKDFLQTLMAPIEVPCLMAQGSNDGCIGAEFFEDLTACFTGEWEKIVIEGGGHFMHREKPEPFNQAALKFLENYS